MTSQTTESIQTNTESDIDDASNANQIDPGQILPQLEAMLVSSDRPLKVGSIVDALAVYLDQTLSNSFIQQAVGLLNEQYDEHKRAFRIEEVSGGFRLMTRPEHASVVASMHRSRSTSRLSKPALETLSIIAYRQPITRAELESIRGVACGEVVRTLMDRRLVKITGRAEELGRPMLYGTTRQFLDTFGLASLKDLPKPEELADQMEQAD
ncbi:MAG: SMC-Scp complex subunit ScpB [Phycisphaerales bacterium]|jgi:segregation and condensation protein B|nr:SMC-Scp complex subunit ScpB [Phycisphaerales bacterium]